jgi:hypothetical protein
VAAVEQSANDDKLPEHHSRQTVRYRAPVAAADAASGYVSARAASHRVGVAAAAAHVHETAKATGPDRHGPAATEAIARAGISETVGARPRD